MFSLELWSPLPPPPHRVSIKHHTKCQKQSLLFTFNQINSKPRTTVIIHSLFWKERGQELSFRCWSHFLSSDPCIFPPWPSGCIWEVMVKLLQINVFPWDNIYPEVALPSFIYIYIYIKQMSLNSQLKAQKAVTQTTNCRGFFLSDPHSWLLNRNSCCSSRLLYCRSHHNSPLMETFELFKENN